MNILQAMIRDLSYAARMLRRSRGFTAMAVMTLALGIGAIAAIFSVVNKVLLEPLPYPEPDRLVQLMSRSQLGDQYVASIPKFVVWRANTRVFDSLAAHEIGVSPIALASPDFSETLRAARVSDEYFSVFGAKMAVGRTFASNEDRPGGPLVVVISAGLWSRRFRADPGIIGRSLSLDKSQYRVVGVLAAGSNVDPPADVWLPLQADPSSVDHLSRVRVLARLKAGMSMLNAQKDVGKTMGPFLRKYKPNSHTEAPLIPLEVFTVVSLRNALVGDVRPTLYLFTGAGGFVLLVSCSNVAGLLLARCQRRASEFATRLALGAQHEQIILQLLSESVLLAVIGGVVGVVLAYLGVRGLVAISPRDLPLVGADGLTVSLNWHVFLFTLAVSALTGIMFGLAPSIYASRTDVSCLVKVSASQSGMNIRRNPFRSGLVITEIALAIVLLVGAGLLIRTFVANRTISRGFDEKNVLTLEMSLSSPQFLQTSEVARLIQTAKHRIRRIQGVSAIATTSALPLQPPLMMPFSIFLNDQVLRYDGAASWRSVSADYFAVFQIRLLRGRIFTDEDDENAARVVVINRAMMKKFWQTVDANPIGEFITIGKGLGSDLEESPRQIIGVVVDIRDAGLDRDPGMYVPVAQVTDGMTARNNRHLPITWAARTDGEQPTGISGIQHELLELSGGRPLGRVRTMHEAISASSARAEFYTTMMVVFAGIALLLAAVSLYTMMAYSVQQRTQEIGIRMAIGATPGDVRNRVMLQALRLALLGVLVGIPAALALARITISVIFGIQAWDPIVLAMVTVLLCVIALLAAWLPAVRATRANPADALRT